MPLTDAVHAIETVGGILLGMSGIAFILFAIFVESRQKSAPTEVLERHHGRGRQLDLAAKTEKRPVSKKAPARKAA
jgi:hypothetical protein